MLALWIALTLAGCEQKPSVSSTPHSVTLKWKASVSKVSGYHVYRADSPNGQPGLLAATDAGTTQYVDSGVESGRTYFYSVKSVGLNETESVFSEKVEAKIPKD